MKNKSDVRVMLQEAGILFAITLLAGLVLGFVYELTKEPIQKQQEKAIQDACAAVFAEASYFEQLAYDAGAHSAEFAQMGVETGAVFAAKSAEGALLGHVVETTTHEGYGGDIVLYVGVTLEGVVNDISILEISETPGLGMQAEKVLSPQFHQVAETEFTYTKTGSTQEKEIDAISGATITTRAVVNAVNAGVKTAADLRKGVQ